MEIVKKNTITWKNMKNMQYLERNKLLNILEGNLGSYTNWIIFILKAAIKDSYIVS